MADVLTMTLLGARECGYINSCPQPTQLDYYNTFYIGLPLKLAPKMKMAQNAADCELISSQHWLIDIDFVGQVLFDRLVLTYRALYGLIGGYMQNYYTSSKLELI